jgi:ribonucleoside-diphosphate reductase alpha chain
MKIKKRNGKLQNLSFNKIIYRLKKLCNDKQFGYKLSKIDIDIVAQRVVSSLYENIESNEIDEEAARIAVSMIDNKEWTMLASRLIISNMHKHTIECFSEAMENINNSMDKSGRKLNLLKPEFMEILKNNKDTIDFAIDYSRDYLFDYFGYKTLEKSYLMKTFNLDENKMILVERPQHLYMRVALAIHLDDIDNVIKTYHFISQHLFTFASPTLFNAGTNKGNLSSCFLLNSSDDLDGIFKTITDCAKISKLGGGIGVNISDIRAKDSLIRGTNGVSNGIVPMLKVYNSTARFANQCFSPETIVYSKNGPKKICDITTNDYLITIDGTFKKVNEVIKNNIQKEILEIRISNSMDSIKVTKEHEIYLIKNQKKQNNQNNQNNYNVIKNRLDRKIIKPEFSSAEHITIDDIVGFPIPTYELNNNIDDLDYYKFYGMMISDGHICENKKESCITLNNNTLTFIENYLNKHNIHFFKNSFAETNNVSIKWTNCDKLNIDRDMLYTKNNEKKIYENFLHLPKQKIKKIIEGMLITDGSNLKELYYHTVSKNLSFQLKYLFLRLGVLTSSSVQNDIRKTHDNIITNNYITHIPRHPILSEIIELKNPSTYFKFFEWDNKLWSRVKSINKINYSGDVYDFNMIDNHNYLTDMGLVHNSGKRQGSFAMYLSPWHADILEFLDMKKNQGSDDIRARDLFYALWVSDVFMKQVEKDGKWYLMCPDECQGLTTIYGDEFETLYWKYVEEKKYKKEINARDVWQKVLESQIETGVPYILYKDPINKKSMQQNIGPINSSNLCAEITLNSTTEEYGTCNLASIPLTKYIEDNKFNFDKLHETAEFMVKGMNKVIYNNTYPTIETKVSNMKNMPIGIGVSGFHQTFIKLKIPFESLLAKQLTREIMETIYHGCVKGSIDMAKTEGPYERFENSPFSKGQFQFDLVYEHDFKETQTKEEFYKSILSGRWDWEVLRTDMKKYGIRNSTLTALMPTASTAQIMGVSESFDPIDSCIFKRRVLSGEYVVINKELIDELTDLKMWNKEMKDLIILHNGSIQDINTIPPHIRELYKTSWEVSMRSVIDLAWERQLFVDHSQSMNLFISNPTFSKLTSMHFYAWKKHLKTGCYYLRSKAKSSAGKFSVDAESEKNLRDKNEKDQLVEKMLVCSIENKEDCLMCTS